MSSLEKIMDSTSRHGTLIKKTLDEIKKENVSYAEKEGSKGDSAKAQMRANLYQTHIRKFHAVMNDYNTAAHGFKQDLQGQLGGAKRNRKKQKKANKQASSREQQKRKRTMYRLGHGEGATGHTDRQAARNGTRGAIGSDRRACSS